VTALCLTLQCRLSACPFCEGAATVMLLHWGEAWNRLLVCWG
jgi:hypothetical protein